MTIKLRFVTCHDAISAAIRAYEYGFWASHVEALIDGKLIGAHYDGGVQARDVGYDASELKQEQYIEIPAAVSITNSFEQFLREQIGKPYDLEAIVAMVVDRNWRNPDSWFCSELVAGGLEECAIIPTLPTAVTHVTPRDAMLIATAIS